MKRVAGIEPEKSVMDDVGLPNLTRRLHDVMIGKTSRGDICMSCTYLSIED